MIPLAKHVDDMKMSVRVMRCNEIAKEMCESMEQSKGYVPVPLATVATGIMNLMENFQMVLHQCMDHAGRLEADMMDLRMGLQQFRDEVIYAVHNTFKKGKKGGGETPNRDPFKIPEIKRQFRRGGDEIKDEKAVEKPCPPEPSRFGDGVEELGSSFRATGYYDVVGKLSSFYGGEARLRKLGTLELICRRPLICAIVQFSTFENTNVMSILLSNKYEKNKMKTFPQLSRKNIAMWRAGVFWSVLWAERGVSRWRQLLDVSHVSTTCFFATEASLPPTATRFSNCCR